MASFPSVTSFPRDSILQGKLIRYGPGTAHTALVSGSGRRHAILVGGLSDGLLFTEYCAPLAGRLEAAGWVCVQPLLSSSLSGWGISNLTQDAKELRRLATVLKQEHGSQGVVILGHSTGCQDAVRYAQLEGQLSRTNGDGTPPLLGAILQAPVSDREFLDKHASTAGLAQRAESMVREGRGAEILCRLPELGSTPISAQRYADLALRRGDDDMFSSDFTDDEFKEVLGCLSGVPSLFVLGLKDECYPEGCDVEALGKRMVRATGAKARLTVLQGDHSLHDCEEQFVDLVMDFIGILE